MTHTIGNATDAATRQAVLQELEWDPRVQETHIGVDVEDGIVTLWGTVGSGAQRNAAAEAAHRVKGVLDVANDIAVEALERSGHDDAHLARTVRKILASDGHLPAARIKSTVSGGVVTLEGEVSSWTQYAEAQRAVQVAAGSGSVINLIRVHAGPAGARRRERVEEALKQEAARESKRAWLDVDDDEL
jgi:osmotically-inducible protein OsmY